MLSDLVAEVRFRERFRGYDCDEVDAYASAVRQAASKAQTRLAEMRQQLDQANAAAEEAAHASRRSGGSTQEIRESLVRTLVLAQRTADEVQAEARIKAAKSIEAARVRAAQTVADAETAASSRLLDAEERATRTLSDAESGAELIISEAKRTALDEMAAARAKSEEQLGGFEEEKARLVREISFLESRRDEQREQLRQLWQDFSSFAADVGLIGESEGSSSGRAPEDAVAAADDGRARGEEPGGAQPTAEPIGDVQPAAERSVREAHVLPAPAPAPPARPAPRQPSAAQPEVAAANTVPPASQKPSSEQSVSQPSSERPAPAAGARASTAPTPVVARTADQTAQPSARIDHSSAPVAQTGHSKAPAAQTDHSTAPDDETGHAAAPAAETGDTAAPDEQAAGEAPQPAQPAPGDSDDGDLDPGDPAGGPADESGERAEFVEQLRRVVSKDGPLTGAHDPMDAFFDQDDEAGKGRWRRRRR